VIFELEKWIGKRIFSIGLTIHGRMMESKAKFKPDNDLRVVDQVRQMLGLHPYVYRTEQVYCD